MTGPVSREKDPSPFAWIFSGALGAVIGGAAWAAGRAALRRRRGEADAAAPSTPTTPTPPTDSTRA